jgi:hypothetical protein
MELFVPCGSDNEYWVRTTNRLRDQLSAAHEQKRIEPHQGIYVEVAGFYSGPPNGETDGEFGREYDETFTITGVSLTQGAPLPGCEAVR